VGTGPTGRSDEENRAVLERFCPRKDAKGRRQWDLDVLVQRGIASEGLDTVDVSEIVNVAPFNGTVQDMQFSGRGSRIMRDMNGEPIEVITTINVDSSTTIAQQERYLGMGFMDIFDSDAPSNAEEEEDEDNNRVQSDPDDNFLPEEPFVMLADVSLVNIKTEPGYREMYDALRADPGAAHKTDTECEEIVEKVLRNHLQERDRSLNASSINAQLRKQINAAISKIVSRLLRRLAGTGVRVERTLPGDLAKRIRSTAKRRFGNIKNIDETELREQYDWLVQLEKDIAIDNRDKLRWLL
jgi:superfamily II DNA or RNA helicase